MMAARGKGRRPEREGERRRRLWKRRERARDSHGGGAVELRCCGHQPKPTAPPAPPSHSDPESSFSAAGRFPTLPCRRRRRLFSSPTCQLQIRIRLTLSPTHLHCSSLICHRIVANLSQIRR
ncbi:hypothetical protein RIF29_05692 [Crotalaria pallida]|uniref:Uncharacterized protein n=1 Tax=Crotalaria pallida TaxID=3830 RepID=A0AAN9P9W5_CROPI